MVRVWQLLGLAEGRNPKALRVHVPHGWILGPQRPHLGSTLVHKYSRITYLGTVHGPFGLQNIDLRALG